MMKQKLQLALALLCVALGSVGTVVPLLPTTPFLLAAAWLYARSSKKRLYKLVRNRYLGPYIIEYYSNRGMSKKIKKRTLIILWASMTVCILIVSNLYIRLLLAAIGVAVTIHVITKRSRH